MCCECEWRAFACNYVKSARKSGEDIGLRFWEELNGYR